jgi:hypothetical protein
MQLSEIAVAISASWANGRPAPRQTVGLPAAPVMIVLIFTRLPDAAHRLLKYAAAVGQLAIARAKAAAESRRKRAWSERVTG